MDLSVFTSYSEPICSLRSIQKYGFNAIIAGGSVRDAYMGEPIKDYDIFIEYPKDNIVDERTIMKAMDIDEKRITDDFLCDVSIECCDLSDDCGDEDEISSSHTNRFGDYRSAAKINTLWNVTVGRYDYQLIFVDKDPVQYVTEHFDLGLCRAYCDGKKLHFSSQFLNDVRNETITICNIGYTKAQFNYMIRNHLVRIKQKYHTFDVVVCPEVAKFVNDSNRDIIYRRMTEFGLFAKRT